MPPSGGFPDGSYSPAQLKDLYASNFPDLLNAEIEGPNVKDGKAVYTFKRTTGTKGRTATQLPKLPESKTSWSTPSPMAGCA